MTSDQATQLLLLVLLLGGPTAIALLYRALVPGHRMRQSHRYLLGGDDPRALGLGDIGNAAYWPCPACNSVNRDVQTRCYHCGTPRPAPADPFATPVLAEPLLPPAELVPPIAPAREPPLPAELSPVPLAAAAPPLARAPRRRRASATPSAEEVATPADAAPPRARRATRTPRQAAPGSSARSRKRPEATNGWGGPGWAALPMDVLPAAGDGATNGVPVMAQPEPATPEQPWCPLLGLSVDPATRFQIPHRDHRCHATLVPARIAPRHQASYCLTAQFPDCARFRARQAVAAGEEAPVVVTSLTSRDPARRAGGARSSTPGTRPS